jgi:hypothetical protein
MRSFRSVAGIARGDQKKTSISKPKKFCGAEKEGDLIAGGWAASVRICPASGVSFVLYLVILGDADDRRRFPAWG